MAKKKTKSKQIINYVFMCVVLVALALVITGMFIGQVIAKTESTLVGKGTSTVYKLFDSDVWGIKEAPITGEKYGVSNVFAIISFVVTLAGLVVLLVDGVLHNCLKKDIKIIRIVGAAVTVVGAILIMVSGLVMAGQCADKLSIDFGDLVQHTYVAGAGVWVGFASGLVGGVCGGLPLLKAFN